MQTVREDNRIFPRLEPLWDDPLTAALATSSAPPPLKERFSGLRNAFVDGNDIVAEIQGGVVTTTYLRGLNIDEPFVRTSSTGQEFYHTDALGSVLALTDQTGAVQTRYRYDPFGNTMVTGTSTNPFQYTGRENDGTGLMFYRARYYSPTLQRFISEDPIGILGDLNFYAYVTNNPVSFVDPYGLVFGMPTGESYGEAATQYWADKYVQTGNPTYAVLGSFSALWTRDTSTQAALTLGGAYAVAGLVAKTGPWLGKIAYHQAHRVGPHQYPHLQIMIRTGKHVTKHFRIRLDKFFAILPLSELLPRDEEFCQGQRKC